MPYYPEEKGLNLVAENEALKHELDKLIPEREKLLAENAELRSRLKEAEVNIHHMKGQLDMVYLIFDRRVSQ